MYVFVSKITFNLKFFSDDKAQPEILKIEFPNLTSVIVPWNAGCYNPEELLVRKSFMNGQRVVSTSVYITLKTLCYSPTELTKQTACLPVGS